MKTIIRFSLLSVFVLFSVAAFATGNFRVNVTTSDEANALVEISNDTDLRYEIKIFNSEGDRVYQHKTKNASSEFAQSLDLSSLDYGWYKMEVTTDGAKYDKRLIVNRSGVQLASSVKKTEPYFGMKNNMVTLSHLNHGQDDLSVHIYENGRLLWEKPLDNRFVLNYGVDISKLSRGNYQVVLVSGNDAYEYEVRR